jgi:hypothetical protein
MVLPICNKHKSMETEKYLQSQKHKLLEKRFQLFRRKLHWDQQKDWQMLNSGEPFGGDFVLIFERQLNSNLIVTMTCWNVLTMFQWLELSFVRSNYGENNRYSIDLLWRNIE